MKSSFLTVYAAAASTAVLALLLTGLAPRASTSLDQLTVHRINVVEPDGTLRVVISDHADLPGIIVHGVQHKFDRPQAGMLFYNDEGSENGGLIFGGRRTRDGKIADAGGSLSFDKYGANQVVQLAGVDDSEDRFAGLIVSDSIAEGATNRRVWIGRTADGVASLKLFDARGRVRMLLTVNGAGRPVIEFLDDKGRAVRSITP